MHQDPRTNPNLAYYANRNAKQGVDDELSRVGVEFDKLRRFGAPTGGFSKRTPAPKPLPPAATYTPPLPTPLPAGAPPVLSGEKRRSDLTLPPFQPPPVPLPASPPQPALRPVGPPPLRSLNVRNVAQLLTALEHARPGDFVVLANGDYALPNKRFSLRGTAQHPVTIMAGGPHVNISGGMSPHTFQLDRSEHVIVNGLRFAGRGPETARAINITDSNHVTIAGCWIGAGAEGRDLAPLHFGADATGRYNNHNVVTGNVIYARGSAAVQFGPGGGHGARVIDNELRALGAEGRFAPLISFTPGGMSTYRQIAIVGNRLISETGTGAGIALNGVIGADVSGNTVRLKRDAVGHAGALLEVRSDTQAGGQALGLVVHHNDLAYDRPGAPDSRAPFGFGQPAQAMFAHNSYSFLGERLVDGRYAPMIDPVLGQH